MTSKPSVLFVCVKNGGKSQMAAGLMRNIVGYTVDVRSAGTKPGNAVNEPFDRGIDGMPRMRLVRDDIAARVRELAVDPTCGR